MDPNIFTSYINGIEYEGFMPDIQPTYSINADYNFITNISTVGYHHIIKGFKTHSDWYNFIIYNLEKNKDKILYEIEHNKNKDCLYERIITYVHEASIKYNNNAEMLFSGYGENKNTYIFRSVCHYAFRIKNLNVMDLFLCPYMSKSSMAYVALRLFKEWSDELYHLYPRSEISNILLYICKLPIKYIPIYINKYLTLIPNVVYDDIVKYAIYENNRELLDMLYCISYDNNNKIFGTYFHKPLINLDIILMDTFIFKTLTPNMFDYLYKKVSDEVKKISDKFRGYSNYVKYAIEADNVILLKHLLNVYFTGYKSKHYLNMMHLCIHSKKYPYKQCLLYLVNHYNKDFTYYLIDQHINKHRLTHNTSYLIDRHINKHRLTYDTSRYLGIKSIITYFGGMLSDIISSKINSRIIDSINTISEYPGINSIATCYDDTDVNNIIRSVIHGSSWDAINILFPFLLPIKYIANINNISSEPMLYLHYNKENTLANLLFYKPIFYLLYHGMHLKYFIDAFNKINRKCLEILLVEIVKYNIKLPDELTEYINIDYDPNLNNQWEEEIGTPTTCLNTFLYSSEKLKSSCTPPTTLTVTEPNISTVTEPNISTVTKTNISTVTEHKPYDTYIIKGAPTFSYIKVGTRSTDMHKMEFLSEDTLMHIIPYLRYTPSVAFIWAYSVCNIRYVIKELNLTFCKWLHMVNTLDFLHSWHACNPVTINMLNILLLPSNYDLTSNISVLEFIIEKCPHLKVLQISIGLENVHTFDYIFYLINSLKYLHTLNITIIYDPLQHTFNKVGCTGILNDIVSYNTITNYGIYNTTVENLTFEYIGGRVKSLNDILFSRIHFIIQSFTKLQTLDCKINHITSLIHKVCLPISDERLKKLKYVYCRYTTPFSEKDFMYNDNMINNTLKRQQVILDTSQYINKLEANTHADLSVILSQYNKVFNLDMQLINII